MRTARATFMRTDAGVVYFYAFNIVESTTLTRNNQESLKITRYARNFRALISRLNLITTRPIIALYQTIIFQCLLFSGMAHATVMRK